MRKLKKFSAAIMLGFVTCMAMTIASPVAAKEVCVEKDIVRATHNIYVKTSTFNKVYGDSTFNLYARCETANLVYETSNPNVVTVDDKGDVTIQGIGSAVITVTALGDSEVEVQTTSREIVVNVSQRDISGIVPVLSYKSCTYNGVGRKPTVTMVCNSVKLIEGIDYKVAYSNNKNVGSAKVTVTGLNNYKGVTATTFTVNPPKVSGVKQVTYGTTYAGISFTKVKGGVSGYKIYRAESKNGTYTLIKKLASNVSSYRDTGLKSGKDYYYKVEAYKTVGGKTYTSLSSSIVKLVTKSPKVAVTLTSGKKKISMRWTKATGAQMYEVYIKSSVKGAYKKIKSTTGTSFTKTGLVSGKTYYVRVKSYRKDAKGKKIYSETSTTKSIKVK